MPPAGARLDVTRTRPGAERGTALFLAGGVRVASWSSPRTGGSLDDAKTRCTTNSCRAGDRPGRAAAPVRIAGRAAWPAGRYITSARRPGTYAVFVADGRAVEVTVSGPEADLPHCSPEPRPMRPTAPHGHGEWPVTVALADRRRAGPAGPAPRVRGAPPPRRGASAAPAAWRSAVDLAAARGYVAAGADRRDPARRLRRLPGATTTAVVLFTLYAVPFILFVA